jgi:CheY-like chemotaxis protein
MSTAPTVYFIDDSATMREVIKIAFRRENMNVVACHDGASALSLMEQQRPDVVISDVIMPGKDGYEVCQQIKQSPQFGKTPVILMSGVVNKSVAERAFAVKADELIRKPFQPQDLITRVRHLLQPKAAAAPAPVPVNAVLSSIFGSAPAPRPVAAPRPATLPTAAAPATAPVAAAPVSVQPTARPAAPRAAISSSMDIAKLRIEILRLEGLVKKLQAELEAEREYSRALEAHIKTLQEAE